MPVSEGKLITNSGVSGFVSTTGNETISGSKTFSAGLTVTDANFSILDDVDQTKTVRVQCANLSPGATVTLTIPGTSGQIAILEGTQTFSGQKTFSATTNTFGSSTATGTTGLASGATTSGATKTVNIGTAGVSGSTTTLIIGSSVSGANGSVTVNHATTFASTARLAGYTVAGLPAAGTAGARALAFVTDSTVTHAGNGGAIVAGGGANFCPVYSDGTNWRIL
jgi:hypothetical protein